MKPILKLTFLTCILVLTFMITSFDSQAHKIKTAFTIILFNERTSNLEVVHRFYLHDAEEAVWEIFDEKADIIGDETTQHQFSEYIINQFALRDQSDKQIQLSTVGFQNDGGYFWVYQEAPLNNNLTTLKVKQQALMDIWSQQYNVVNIEGLDKVYTLNFSSPDQWQTVAINQTR